MSALFYGSLWQPLAFLSSPIYILGTLQLRCVFGISVAMGFQVGLSGH